MANLARSSSTGSTVETADVLPIGDAERMPAFGMTMAWWAVCSGMFYIVVGATLAQAYGAEDAIIGMLLSVFTYAAVNGMVSRYAIKTGLSVALFSKVLFGKSGAAIATLILFVAAIYYAMFEGMLIAGAIHALYDEVGYKVAALIVVGYSVPLVFGSVQNWLNKFNGVLLPFYLLGLAAAVGLTATRFAYNGNWLSSGPAGIRPTHGWWNCFVYYMGVWGLMMFTFDFARLGRRSDVTFHARFTFGLPFYLVTFLLNGVVGIYLVSSNSPIGTLSEMAVVLALLKLMGFWGLAFVWVTQTRINTASYYLATVNMKAFIDKVSGKSVSAIVCAVLVGIAVYCLMIGDFLSQILTALAYQGVFIVAWVGVAVAHIGSDKYTLLFPGDVECRDACLPHFNPAGMTSWLMRAAVGLVVMHVPAWASFLASWLTYRLMLVRAKPAWFAVSPTETAT